MEPSLARVKAFDWLRGLAVLVMIECHAMVLLHKELLATRAASVMDWLNGLVAPSFIFAAGFSLALVQVRTARSGGARGARFLRTLRRIGEVLAVGTLINYVWFPVWVEPAWLLRVDILQCIGVSLLFARRSSPGWRRGLDACWPAAWSWPRRCSSSLPSPTATRERSRIG